MLLSPELKQSRRKNAGKWEEEKKQNTVRDVEPIIIIENRKAFIIELNHCAFWIERIMKKGT